MNKKNEYIEINLMSFFVILYKNLKTLIFFIILGSLILFFTFNKKEKSFMFKQMIEIPSYVDDKNSKPIIRVEDTNLILQMILKEEKQNSNNDLLKKIMLLSPTDNYNVATVRQTNTQNGNKHIVEVEKLIKDSNYKLKQKYDNQRKYFTLLVASKKDDINKVSQEYEKIMRSFSESELTNSKISLWQQNINRNIKVESENLIEYKKMIKHDVGKVYNQLPVAQKPTTGKSDQNQSITVKMDYSSIQIMKEIITLKQSIDQNRLELESANLKFSNYGGIMMLPNKGGALSKKVLLIAIFMVLFGSVVLTFLVDFFRKVAKEAKA